MSEWLHPTDIMKLPDGRELRIFAKNDQGQFLLSEQKHTWITAIVEEWQGDHLLTTHFMRRDPTTIAPTT